MPPERSGVPLAYASVDAVNVPSGIAPGAHFTAHVWATRRGERVAVSKHFWRASGNVPCIMQPDVAVAQGPRHAQRPRAVARRLSGDVGAQAIDHLQSQQCRVTQWQTAVEMPIELNAADVGWLPGPVNGNAGRAMPAFTGTPSGTRDRELSSRTISEKTLAKCSIYFGAQETTKAHGTACDRRIMLTVFGIFRLPASLPSF